ncbi:hypothetical protein EU527_04325 [Candidatus Thorarchaeota archaeon]|nr:MAG: hypothetical protein EU527_04325 [Candidatus Thorarchaeota archaeon]
MRNYETGLSNKFLASAIVAVIITAGVLIVAINLPGGGIIPTTPTTTTTTPTNPVNGLGARAAVYLNSMRDNVVFYWMCNSTFVNLNLSTYYNSVHPGAYVDGVYMTENETGGEINILFHPYYDNIVGKGTLTENEWNSLSGSIIDDGIGQMVEATTHPSVDWPHTWPIDFYITVYFNDNTCFYFGFTSGDGFAYMRNGTWSGTTDFHGEPAVISWGEGFWLNEDGHLEVPLQNLYEAITNTVSYPE